MTGTALLALTLAACGGATPGSAQQQTHADAAGFAAGRLDEVTRFLRIKASEGAFPGGVLVVGRGSGVTHVSAVGRYGEDDARPVDASTIYDLASLTKVIGLTTAVMILVCEGKLDLDRPVSAYVPEFAGAGHEGVLVRHLLTHTSGLEAWAPLYRETSGPSKALERIYRMPLAADPGSTYVYSDLGAILLTQVVERVAARPLDVFLAERVFEPLRMDDTRFRPPASWRQRIAPTEWDPWRGRMIRGEVHDENAAHLGGVSGHAGLFSTGPDLARFAVWMLDGWHGRTGRAGLAPLPAALVREFTRRQPGPEGSTRALGWDTPTPGGGISSGSRLSPSAFGHTGFTGTSIWIDPELDLFIILLTNRVHPTRDNRALLPIRGHVADLVVQALGAGAGTR